MDKAQVLFPELGVQGSRNGFLSFEIGSVLKKTSLLRVGFEGVCSSARNTFCLELSGLGLRLCLFLLRGAWGKKVSRVAKV